MTHTHTHTHFLRYFVWGNFFFRSIQLCMYTQHTQTPFLKSKVAHTHSHMNDLRYTKSDTRMLVKQQTVTMRLAVIVAMLTHGVCVCVYFASCYILSHRIQASKHTQSSSIHPYQLLCLHLLHTLTHTYKRTQQKKAEAPDTISYHLRCDEISRLDKYQMLRF